MRTQEEWDWLWKELNAITPDLWKLNYLWMSATDEEKEGVWRDYYTQQKLETGVAWPWYSSAKDADKGDKENCLIVYTDEDEKHTWSESECYSYEQACPCHSKE